MGTSGARSGGRAGDGGCRVSSGTTGSGGRAGRGRGYRVGSGLGRHGGRAGERGCRVHGQWDGRGVVGGQLGEGLQGGQYRAGETRWEGRGKGLQAGQWDSRGVH